MVGTDLLACGRCWCWFSLALYFRMWKMRGRRRMDGMTRDWMMFVMIMSMMFFPFATTPL
jgi:hypothetical protein